MASDQIKKGVAILRESMFVSATRRLHSQEIEIGLAVFPLRSTDLGAMGTV